MISKKKKRGQADVLIYATSYCFTGHGPVPMSPKREPILWRTALQAASEDTIYIRGRCPRLLMVVPSRHQSACGN